MAICPIKSYRRMTILRGAMAKMRYIFRHPSSGSNPDPKNHAMFGFPLFILSFIFFAVMSYRVFPALRRQAAVLAEFGQAPSLAYWTLLFPLGVLILMIGSYYLIFLLAYILALACYLPAMVISRRQARALDRAGTDRVQKAQAALNLAFGTALVGVIYVAMNFILAVAYTF